MPCDRLLFISGHKSNSFHNSTDFFHLATFIHRHFLHCTQYPLTQLSNMHYYFILSVQFLLPSRLNCMHMHSATYHLVDGDTTEHIDTLLYDRVRATEIVICKEWQTKNASVESKKANAPGNTMVVLLKIIKSQCTQKL